MLLFIRWTQVSRAPGGGGYGLPPGHERRYRTVVWWKLNLRNFIVAMTTGWCIPPEVPQCPLIWFSFIIVWLLIRKANGHSTSCKAVREGSTRYVTTRRRHNCATRPSAQQGALRTSEPSLLLTSAGHDLPSRQFLWQHTDQNQKYLSGGGGG